MSRLGEVNLRRLRLVTLADAAAHTPETERRMIARAEETGALLEEILAEKPSRTTEDLAIGGADLLELGMAPGPAIGKLLRELLEDVWDETTPNEREALLRRAREWKEKTI